MHLVDPIKLIFDVVMNQKPRGYKGGSEGKTRERGSGIRGTALSVRPFLV